MLRTLAIRHYGPVCDVLKTGLYCFQFIIKYCTFGRFLDGFALKALKLNYAYVVVRQHFKPHQCVSDLFLFAFDVDVADF